MVSRPGTETASRLPARSWWLGADVSSPRGLAKKSAADRWWRAWADLGVAPAALFLRRRTRGRPRQPRTTRPPRHEATKKAAEDGAGAFERRASERSPEHERSTSSRARPINDWVGTRPLASQPCAPEGLRSRRIVAKIQDSPGLAPAQPQQGRCRMEKFTESEFGARKCGRGTACAGCHVADPLTGSPPTQPVLYAWRQEGGCLSLKDCFCTASVFLLSATWRAGNRQGAFRRGEARSPSSTFGTRRFGGAG